MKYEKALARFKSFGTFCDDRNDACDQNCDECDLMESAIIEALEKQTPKKPTEYDNCGNITATDRCCLCNEIVYREYTHCPYCGQKISWEG